MMLYLNGGTLCLGYIIGTTYGNIFDGLGKMIGCVNCMISPHSNGGLNIGLCVKWMVTKIFSYSNFWYSDPHSLTRGLKI